MLIRRINVNKAVILGATGEVGGHILDEILAGEFYQKIYVLGRASIYQIPNDPRIVKVLIDFNHLKISRSILNDADVFYAVGTDNRANFEQVDFGYAYSFALLCRGRIKSFNLVSAMGANVNSQYRYVQVKGKLEAYLANLDLGIQRFYRPAMLMAPNRSDLKTNDAIAIKFFERTAFLLRGPLKNWHGIRPQTVATAMVKNAINNSSQHIYRYTEMIQVVNA